MVAKKKVQHKGRKRKPWKVEVFLDGKRKGSYNGEQLVEALIAAEEKILYGNKEDETI
jgi:hypothetical protein